MYTQQSRRPDPVSVNAKLQKTACSSFLDFKSTHTSKLLKGMGDEKRTYQHEYFNIYQAQWLMNGSSILLLYPRCVGLKEEFHKVSVGSYLVVVIFFCECLPWPMRAPVRASLALPKPSSLQTTLADCRFQRSSQTVPHSLSFSTSTRPSPSRAPPFSLTFL